MLEKFFNMFRRVYPDEFGYKDFHSFEFLCDGGQEKFEADWKSKYPISFYYHRGAKVFFKKIINVFQHMFYYLKSHLVPSARYHIINISQPSSKDGTIDEYKWGWIDADRRLTLAAFTVFVEFVENELQVNKKGWDVQFIPDRYIAEDPFSETLYKQNEAMKTVKTIYEYWTVSREFEWDRYEKALEEWRNYNSVVNKEKKDELFNRALKLEESFYKTEEEMFIKLVKVRKVMWT